MARAINYATGFATAPTTAIYQTNLMTRTAANNYSVFDPASPNFGDWSIITPGGDGSGTITYSNQGQTAEITSTTGEPRFYLQHSQTYVVGQFYMAILKVNSISGSFSGNNFDAFLSISSGNKDFMITETGYWYCVFEANATSGSTRLGIGTGSSSNPNMTLNFDVPMIISVPSITPTGIHPPLSFTKASYSNLSTSTLGETQGSAGLATFAVGAATAPLPRNVTGVITGDSFSNDFDEWPDRVAFSLDDSTLYVDALLGRTLDTANSTLADAINLTDMDGSLNTPTFLGIQGGQNDLIADRSLAQLQSSIQTLVATSRSNGITDIFIMNISPFNTTAPRETIRTDFNTWLEGYTSGESIGLVDIAQSESDGGLANNSDATLLAATYDSGDGRHPNLAGANAIRDLVKPVVALFPLTGLAINTEINTEINTTINTTIQ